MNMRTNDHLIAMENVQFRYPGGEAMHFPDLTIDKGQHTLLLGNSGTGKTTFLHILTGLLAPTEGQVSVAGQQIYNLPARKLDHFRGQEIGIVFQNAHLISSLTLEENIQIAQEFAGTKRDRDHIVSILSSLDLADQGHKYPRQLSRGQLQRAGIARALVNRPATLIADEPTASLDDTNTARVMDLLFKQAEEHGATLIIATHDQRIKNRFTHTYILT